MERGMGAKEGIGCVRASKNPEQGETVGTVVLNEERVAEFLVGEAVLHCGQQGASTIEMQIASGDGQQREFVERVGFELVDRGLWLSRAVHR